CPVRCRCRSTDVLRSTTPFLAAMPRRMLAGHVAPVALIERAELVVGGARRGGQLLGVRRTRLAGHPWTHLGQVTLPRRRPADVGARLHHVERTVGTRPRARLDWIHYLPPAGPARLAPLPSPATPRRPAPAAAVPSPSLFRSDRACRTCRRRCTAWRPASWRPADTAGRPPLDTSRPGHTPPPPSDRHRRSSSSRRADSRHSAPCTSRLDPLPPPGRPRPPRPPALARHPAPPRPGGCCPFPVPLPI